MSYEKKIVLAALIIAIAIVPLTHAQSLRPAFEVASVKRRPPGSLYSLPSGVLRGNRYVAKNYTLKRLVQVAYGAPFKELLPDQIIGGPQWIQTDSFDVEGKVDDSSGPVPVEQVLLMLRSLLEDRFHLKAHLEKRELSVYDLVVAKPEKLRLSKDQTPSDPVAAVASATPGTQPRGLLTIGSLPSGRGVKGDAVPLSQLALVLETLLRRPVLDKTNLDSLFDIRLSMRVGNDPSPQAPLNVGPTSSDPSSNIRMFPDIQDELGLRLVSTKAPLQVVVIDHVQKSSEN